MSDNEQTRLLAEIRDLLREHNEHYLKTVTKFADRQRKAALIGAIMIGLLVAYVVFIASR